MVEQLRADVLPDGTIFLGVAYSNEWIGQFHQICKQKSLVQQHHNGISNAAPMRPIWSGFEAM